MHKPLPSIETLISRNAKEVSEISQVYLREEGREDREEDASKVSYFQFPNENIKKKRTEWIHAIKREEGKDFKISESTKVCSRDFRKEDLKKTLAGKICYKSGALP